MSTRFLIMILLGVMLTGSPQVGAQQVVLSAPHVRITQRWYENLGSSFYLEQNFPRGGWFFNWGAPVIPPFGGYDGRDARFGVGFRHGNLRGRFNLWTSQGVDRSMVMESPFIIVPNGGFGSIQHGSWRPFVTGWTPVLGNQPQWEYPLRNYIQSEAINSLTTSRSGDTNSTKIERVPQTLATPRQDPPLNLINGEDSSQ